MANKEELQILLTMKDNATKELKKVDTKLKKMGGGFKKLGEIAKKVAIGIGAIGAVAVVAGAKAIKAFQAQEIAEKRLETIAKQVTGATDEQIDSFKKLATQMQKVGVVGDEVIIAGQSQIASFTKSSEVVAELSDDLADLAVAQYGTSVSQEQAIQTANLLGKALSGQLGALTRTGILVNDDFKTAFENANSEQERAVIISKIVQDNYGGLNKTLRETSEGGVQALKNNFGDLMELVGERLVPILQVLVETATTIIETFTNVMTSTGGLKAILTGFFEFIDEKTGLITILKQSWENIVLMFNERLRPALAELWEQLQPLKPFLILLAKIFGVILIGAIIAFVKLVEVTLIVAIELLTRVIGWVNEKITFFKEGWDAVITTLSKVVNWIDTLIEKIKKLNVIQGAKNLISKGLGFVSGKAIGGSVFENQPVKVGENGAEMFVPNSGGKIIPNNRMGGGGGTNINITINGDVTGEDAMDTLSQKIMENLGLNARLTAGA